MVSCSRPYPVVNVIVDGAADNSEVEKVMGPGRSRGRSRAQDEALKQSTYEKNAAAQLRKENDLLSLLISMGKQLPTK